MRAAAMLVALAACVFTLAGCGGDDGGSTTQATPADTSPSATTDTMTTATSPAQAKEIAIRVVDGVPEGGIQRPTLEKGDKVLLVVRTDSGEAVHLHGYNIEKDVVPGKPVRIAFTANLPGRFEVELHPTDTLLAVVEVKP